MPVAHSSFWNTASARTSASQPISTRPWPSGCHALPLTHIAVDLKLEPSTQSVCINAVVETQGKTGVEMEALVAATHAALTVYDMLKGVDRSMTIGPTRLLAKSGGASGRFVAEGSPDSQGAEARDSQGEVSVRAAATLRGREGAAEA